MTKTKEIILLLLLPLIFTCGAYAKPAPVMTEYGLVQGTAEDDITVYRGIPFAAPPVGDLRWKAPQPAEKWDGVRQATNFANDPYQGDGNGNVGEDCLYLNVWTPAKSPDEKLPVMVWIYGGGFSFGSTSTPVHNGEFLARKGVILVSINYRVGVLGFLAHPELSAESPDHISGNYGILDQIAGLKWVQKNIAAFGGDPEKVTIFGESAGAISVSMLCASPEAKGLFRGAISQSGGSFGPTRPTTFPGENMKALEQAEAGGLAYMKEVCAASLADLRKMSPKELPNGWTTPTTWPNVDGKIIIDDQFKLYEAGNYNDVDILVGYNSDEGLSFTWEKSPEQYIQNTHHRYGPYADKLLQAYPTGKSGLPKSARDLMRDAAFGWQTWSWARLQNKTGKSNVYFYYFDQHADHDPDSPEADHGTPHGVDVPYVFHTLGSDASSADKEMSDLLSTYWTNFAKYGTPNGSDLPYWPAYEGGDDKVMHFHNGASAGELPSADSLKVLDEYFAWRRTPEGAAWAK
ncbi:MAG: carboxylesterase family protein [Opitutales bacterium]|nr:carboxylesterase family protein [Opitutales bacterium]